MSPCTAAFIAAKKGKEISMPNVNVSKASSGDTVPSRGKEGRKIKKLKIKHSASSGW